MPDTPTPERKWYSTAEVADALGVHVTTIRRRIYQDVIPGHQLGQTGPWRVPAWWLHREMDKRRPPVERPRRRMVTLK
jgi:excisionase family DNA binding protein